MRDFNHSVNVLVKAYFYGDLEHQNCACCAVGNLMADACGYKIEHLNDDKSLWTRSDDRTVIDPIEWVHVFGTKTREEGKNFFRRKKISVVNTWFDLENVTTSVNQWAAKTGYSLVELARIENAFESAQYGENDDTWMFNGLMAVVDVLADIHGINLESKEEAKKLFVRV
jgi:hypothetical protein